MTQPSPPPATEATVTLRRFADRSQLQRAIEERLQQVLTGADGAAPAVMLSGGSTPIPAYLELATRGLVPAPGLTVLFSDDRYVPSDSDQSNYHQSRALFTALGLTAQQVLRIRTELPLAQATADSERAAARAIAQRRSPHHFGALGDRRGWPYLLAVFRRRSRALARAAGHQRASTRWARRRQCDTDGARTRRSADLHGGGGRQAHRRARAAAAPAGSHGLGCRARLSVRGDLGRCQCAALLGCASPASASASSLRPLRPDRASRSRRE